MGSRCVCVHRGAIGDADPYLHLGSPYGDPHGDVDATWTNGNSNTNLDAGWADGNPNLDSAPADSDASARGTVQRSAQHPWQNRG